MKSRSHRLPTISDTPDDWVDESWTVDCVCGVNFDDGEEMVDCDECGVWVHTRCSRYVKSEKLFACDKCKSKKLRKETEETEVAQLLVELPTKTLRMDNPYPMGCPPQNSFQVWTEIPLEEKVHVQGIPGGDSSLFRGMSSVFSPELWKCTGYVPKKFNFQYREFPCWDERQDDGNKGKEEIENHASKGADALFSLSKENALPAQVATFAGLKTQVNGGCALDMGPPTTDMKKQEVENYEGQRQHSDGKKERSLLKPIVIHSGNQKKLDSRVFKDLNRKKNTKVADKEDPKKRGLHSFESVSTTSSDANESEPYEGKGPKVVKTDKQSCKHEHSRADVQGSHKSDSCLDIVNTNNSPISGGQPSENVSFDDSRRNPSKEAKQMEENDGNQVLPSVEVSSQTEDGMALSLIHNPMETITMKDEVGHDVDDVNDNGRSCSGSNGTHSHVNNLEKVDSVPNGELLASPLQPIKIKAVEINHPGKTSSSQNVLTSDLRLDSSKSLTQDTMNSAGPLSASFEVKKDIISGSQVRKVKKADRSTPHMDSQADEHDESSCGPCQPKGHMKGSESSTVARNSSEFKLGPGPAECPSKLHGPIVSPSAAPNDRKVTISAIGKSSSVKPSSSTSAVGISKPSAPDTAKYSSTDDCNSSPKQKGTCDNNIKSKKDNTSSQVPWNGDVCEKPKKLVKELPKSLSTSALKSSHLSKSSHTPVSKKNSSDSKDPAILSSSKTSSVQIIAGTPDTGESANSLQCDSGALAQNKSTSDLLLKGEKVSLLNRQTAPKNHPPHVHPPASTNSPATLSDEELALLLHQELNSSPRVPRVPRMRHAGSLPQLASTTSTSTLMKRTSTSGGKDNGLVSRKKNKDLAGNGPSNSREFDGAKKVDRVPSLPNSRRHDLVKNGSAKVMHSVDKSALPASMTVSSGPSSTEANEQNMSTRNSPQNASDDETGAIGVPTNRTLPGLIAEIMSKGKRMTYEELCNAVLPHWPNLRKHNGERYAYSSHSQAVLDCLRNRSEWSRLVDRGPKTNAGRKRRKSEADAQNLESEEDDYSTDRNTKDVDSKSVESQRDEFPKGKRKARKHRRLALQGRGIKVVRRRRKAEVVSDDIDSSSDSSKESVFSDEEMQSVANETSASSDEMGAMS